MNYIDFSKEECLNFIKQNKQGDEVLVYDEMYNKKVKVKLLLPWDKLNYNSFIVYHGICNNNGFLDAITVIIDQQDGNSISLGGAWEDDYDSKKLDLIRKKFKLNESKKQISSKVLKIKILTEMLEKASGKKVSLKEQEINGINFSTLVPRKQ